jgi:hypothetical protein
MAKLKTERAFFDSQQQAAALLNVPIGLISQAKREGCLAFRSGRVYVEPIKEWLARARHAAKRPREEDNEREIRLQQAQLRLEREAYEFAQTKERMLAVEQFELGLSKVRAAFEKELAAFGRRINDQSEGLDFDQRAEMIDREVRTLKERLARCDYLAAD